MKTGLKASGVSFRRLITRWPALLPATALLAACGGSPEGSSDPSLASVDQALGEDGLADGFATFKQSFVGLGFDQNFTVGYAFHPGLSTEKLTGGGQPPKGSAILNFANQSVNATLNAVPPGANFDLWFVKNVAGSGRTVRPESGDHFFRVGSFGPPGETSRCFGATGCLSLDVVIGSNINFDLDMVVVTRRGRLPSASRIAVGSRTLFEKRFFRERAGRTLDPVSGSVANNVETTDQLVARGAQLFFNETFGGNGRTCGTCHRAENNLTIDPQFIAGLPQSDPLFVNETNPALAQLEDSTLLRTRALIRENVDGFDDPTHKFVERSVNHTFSLGLTNDIAAGGFGGSFPTSPPDQRLGWGGDGSPGRGTLNEFAFGAVVQHFTKNLARRPGVDFRIPTQEELDALEAFQLFTGRQKFLVDNLQFRDPRAQQGHDLFNSNGQCTFCHSDFNQSTFNGNFNTNVVGLTPELPVDDGFLDVAQAGDATFNVPPLVEAADTGPFFHNNGKPDIESAVGFYISDTFRASGIGRFLRIDFNETQQANIAAFLRVLNAAENVRQVRKRVQFVRNNRTAGNTDLLTLAIADTQDAIDDLNAKGLNPAAVNELLDVKVTLETAKANADANRPAFMDHALVFLNLVKSELFSSNPNDQF